MKENNRNKTIITGVTCPRCERKRSERTADENGRSAYRCTFCGHLWTPKP